MALQTSGAISFSQIASHFGGSGSHSLSEYRALAGQGVSGIPSSGTISFSHFHGKSNQVVRSVWVSSGYNRTQEELLATYQGGTTSYTIYNGPGYWAYSGDYFRVSINAGASLPAVYYSVNARGRNPTWNSNRAYKVTQYILGTRRYVRGAYRGDNRGSTKVYQLHVYDQVTRWIDTSSYQNQTATARITT